MAIRIPTASGSYFGIDTALPSNSISLFFRVRRHTDRNADSWLGTIGMSGTSTWRDTSTASTGQMHGVNLASDGDSLEGFAFWDWTSPSLTDTLDNVTWYNVAICTYGTNANPKVKLAVRAHPSGTLRTVVREDGWFDSVYDNFTNARLQVGAGSGGANPSGCDICDVIVYNADYSSDANIEAQFDSIAPVHASPWSTLSCRDKASVAAAALDETNSNNWTVVGAGVTLVDTDNPTFGATIYGNDIFPTETTEPAPADPTGLSATVLSSSQIRLDWTDNATTETSYVVEERIAGSATWSLAGSTGPNTETLTVANLSAGTSYEFRVYASGAGGSSGYTSTVTATTKSLIARGYAHSSAQGVDDVKVSVWTEPTATQNHGVSIIQLDGQSFSDSLTTIGGVAMASISVPIQQIADPVGNPSTGTPDGLPILVNGDDVVMYASAVVDGASRNTPIFYATVVEE